MANVKLSQISSGGQIAGATDVCVAVRSGTTDVLVTPVTLDLAQTWTATQTHEIGTLSLLGSSTGYTLLNSANASATNYTITVPAATGTLPLSSVALTWTAAQTFTNSDIKLLGSSTGSTTFASANAGATNYTLTIPATTDTLAVLGTTQTFTASQTFTNSDLKLLGSSTGSTTFASANASSTNYTLTFPATTGMVSVSASPINVGSSLTAAFGGKYNLNTAAGSVLTLPAATGSGSSIDVYVTTATTSNAHKILAASTSDFFQGMSFGQHASAAFVFTATATTIHSIQMPFTGSQPSGGLVGDKYTLTDIAANLWQVNGFYTAGTTPTNPFSTADA